MREYNEFPDKWVIVDWGDGQIAVLCGWGGSYTYGASWKRSSPIQSIESEDGIYYMTTASGNVYALRESGIGYTSMSFGIAAKLSDFGGITIISDEDEVHERIKSFKNQKS